MQKPYIKVKDNEEMYTMLEMSKKNHSYKNYFLVGIVFGITIGSILTALSAIIFIAVNS